MTQAQAQAFESWFAETLVDGVQWFNMPLRTPMGPGKLLCRFMDMYEGPDLVGIDRWQISAPVKCGRGHCSRLAGVAAGAW